VQLCAAVGAPDAYAGELPVVFATLVPGASVTEEELLAFTAARVDEAPARPKSITIIPSMPMTNVGKIYKPELRMLAACNVAAAMAAEIAAGLGLAPAARPHVQADGDQAIQVLIDPQAVGAQAPALQQQLQQALGRLPVKVQVVLL
jgi:fatty-acyl-CoA synthase